MLKVWLTRCVFNLLIAALWFRRKPFDRSPDKPQISNFSIPGRGGLIKLRLYTPAGEGPFALLIYLHGGGFVLGNLATADAACRDICVRSQHAVLSVDYRLAPEAPFPAAIDDAVDVLRWVREQGQTINVDMARIFVAGDSAGGNLAAVLALHAKTHYPTLLKGQILIYPVTHHYSNATASYSEKARGYGLTRAAMQWFWDLYYANSTLLSKGQVTHPLSTPLDVYDLSGLPPALVLTAEHDPLRDEGIAYAKKMAAAAVPVQHSLYHGERHGFIGTMGPTQAHNKGIAEIVQWLDGR